MVKLSILGKCSHLTVLVSAWMSALTVMMLNCLEGCSLASSCRSVAHQEHAALPVNLRFIGRSLQHCAAYRLLGKSPTTVLWL